MKRLLLASAALAALTVGAAAADLPVKAPVYDPVSVGYNWSGFYAGLNAGMVGGRGDDEIAGANKLSTAVINTGLVPGSLATSSSAPLAGITAGYNYQVGRYVLGVESDFDWSGIKKTTSQSLSGVPLGIPASLTTTATHDSGWLGTVRARVGWAFLPSTMVYATAGLAYAGENESTNVSLATPIPALTKSAGASTSSARLGWTAGGGVESALAGGWTWKAEYLYVGLGSQTQNLSTVIAGAPVAFTAKQNLNEQLVRAGLNYRF